MVEWVVNFKTMLRGGPIPLCWDNHCDRTAFKITAIFAALFKGI